MWLLVATVLAEEPVALVPPGVMQLRVEARLTNATGTCVSWTIGHSNPVRRDAADVRKARVRHHPALPDVLDVRKARVRHHPALPDVLDVRKARVCHHPALPDVIQPTPPAQRCEHSGMRTIWTIGHSNRSLEDFVGVLDAWKIDLLADVRQFTRSRANPQFNADTLATRLGADRYVHLAALGGRRKVTGDDNLGWEHPAFRGYADYTATEAFRVGLAALEALAEARPTALMCAEILWWRCHRRILADNLIARGWEVWHLRDATHTERAVLTPFARVTGTEVRYPAPAPA